MNIQILSELIVVVGTILKFLIVALLAVAAAAPSYPAAYSAPATYSSGYHAPAITIVSESDVRNLDGSGHWR